MLNATRVEIFRKTIFLALGSMTITAVYDKLVVAGGLLSVSESRSQQIKVPRFGVYKR